ncbi:hypothetical protein CN497_09720 [Priestia megaterium]|uniref:Uncharacterized protein n=1 Tax=Priestia megaterium TaxID=1404 RepID=A0AAE5P872_PRIMG|nr:hypothetical protein CN497_09720 [Priestia megaterium]
MLIGGQGEDSCACGQSGTGETPQERKQRGGSSAARGKRSLARQLTALAHLPNLFVFTLD